MAIDGADRDVANGGVAAALRRATAEQEVRRDASGCWAIQLNSDRKVSELFLGWRAGVVGSGCLSELATQAVGD